MGSIFVHLCGAHLRKKPGQFCRAPALRGHPHCRLHLGRPPGSGSPEGLAASRTGRAAYYAKYRAAKARGEPVTLPGGRGKRWPIARPWRFQPSPEDEARVSAAMAAYDVHVRGGEPRPPWQRFASRRDQARDLERLERGFILALNDHARALSSGEAERVYDNIRQYEATYALFFGPEPGSDTRLQRLKWEIDRLRRLSRDSDAITAGHDRAEHGESPPVESPQSLVTAPHEPLPDPFAGSDACQAEPVEASRHFGVFAPPSPDPRRPAGMSSAEWKRTIERTEAMLGHFRRSVEARAWQPADDWRPRSIAPWLSQKR